MSKFGTQLVREGLVSPQQLEEGMRMQTLYGGRLGSNLVELNFVHVDTMSDFLGRLSGFPVATQQMVDDASEEAIALVPADMAERLECLPLRKDGRRLHMAMVQPENLAATDALSFKTGLRIVPYFVLELRLHFALEEKYGVVKRERSVGLQSRDELILRARASSPPPPASSGEAMPELPPLTQPPADKSPEPVAPTAPATPTPTPRAPSTSLPPGWSETPARSTPPRPVTAPSMPVMARPPIEAAQAVELLRAATSRDEIADILLRCGAGLGDTVFLFLVREGMALGWKSRGEGLEPDIIERVMLPLNAPSIFQQVNESQQAFSGAVSEQVLHRHFYKALRREPPASLALVPIVMRERVVNLVYVEKRDGDAQAVSEILTALAPHVVASYERIVREAKR